MFESLFQRFQNWKSPHFFRSLGFIGGALAGVSLGIDSEVNNVVLANLLHSPLSQLEGGAEAIIAIGGCTTIGALVLEKLGAGVDHFIDDPDSI